MSSYRCGGGWGPAVSLYKKRLVIKTALWLLYWGSYDQHLEKLLFEIESY